MAKSVTLTKTAAGNFYIVEKNTAGTTINEKPFISGNFDVSSQKGTIRILAPESRYYPIMLLEYLPAEWTIGGVNGYTTILQVCEAITTLANS
jgi:hypothetical protein